MSRLGSPWQRSREHRHDASERHDAASRDCWKCGGGQTAKTRRDGLSPLEVARAYQRIKQLDAAERKKQPDAESLRLERRLGLCQAAALNVVNTVGFEPSIVIATLLAVMMEPPVLVASGVTAMLVLCDWIGSSEL